MFMSRFFRTDYHAGQISTLDKFSYHTGHVPLSHRLHAQTNAPPNTHTHSARHNEQLSLYQLQLDPWFFTLDIWACIEFLKRLIEDLIHCHSEQVHRTVGFIGKSLVKGNNSDYDPSLHRRRLDPGFWGSRDPQFWGRGRKKWAFKPLYLRL